MRKEVDTVYGSSNPVFGSFGLCERGEEMIYTRLTFMITVVPEGWPSSFFSSIT